MARTTIPTVFTAVDKMTKPINGMQARIKKFAIVAGTALLTGGIIKGFRAIANEARNIEDATAAFTPLVGGVEKATQLVEMLNTTAASTPFQFDDIKKTAEQLLPIMNGDLQKTVDTFRLLGDTAGGNTQKLESVTRGYSKALLKGKVDMESLNMITEAGVPIVAEMAKGLGISNQQLFKMITAGKITTDQLTETFQTMTSEGGLFFNGMEIASGTLSGKLSTLGDIFKAIKASLGSTLLPILKSVTEWAIALARRTLDWVNANKGIIRQKMAEWWAKLREIGVKVLDFFTELWPMIKKIAGAVGILTGAFMVIIGLWESGIIPVILTLIGVIKAATIASNLFNISLLANPIMLIIIAVIALIGFIILAVVNFDKWTAAIGQFFNKLLGGGKVIDFIKEKWKKLTDFFRSGGLIKAIQKIGGAIKLAVLTPIQKVLALLSKLPLVGKLFGKLNDKVLGSMQKTQGGLDRLSAPSAAAGAGIVSRNESIITNNTSRTTRSEVAIKMSQVPTGSEVKARNLPPNISVDYGFRGGVP